MHKLFVLVDPVHFTEIFELTNKQEMRKISQLRLPQESIEFIKNYSNNIQKEVDVTYIGPVNYVNRFVNEANNLEFVTAHMTETED